MASFNKVILLGNLTRDPEVKYTPGGTAVATIGLAVNRKWFDKQANQQKEETTFVDVTLWGRQAEVAGEYLAKGRAVLIEGRLQLDQWDDKQTGEKRSKLKVVGESMSMVGGGKQEGGGEQRQEAPQRTQGRTQGGNTARQSSGRQQTRQPAPEAFHDEEAPHDSFDDSDVPF